MPEHQTQGEKLATGFHCCLDYELEWNPQTLQQLIHRHQICHADLNLAPLGRVETEKQLLVEILRHLQQGTGGEIVPSGPGICSGFAAHFRYRQTVGGTAARAALALQKIGCRSLLQVCCLNPVIQTMIPDEISCMSSAGCNSEIYPHVILQYPAGAQIRSNGLQLVTPRENRVMFSYDPDSLNYQLTEQFIPALRDTEVFLLSCFSQVLDFELLQKRVMTTRKILRSLPSGSMVILEDGDYAEQRQRRYVHQQLASEIDLLSMNEDELRQLAGGSLNMLSPTEVLQALERLVFQLEIPYILVHSSAWALVYGERPGFAQEALRSGIALAATRFRKGDCFSATDWQKTKKMPNSPEGSVFCDQLKRLAPARVCCVPGKDLRSVNNPTVVGLGDYFAGGLLPELTLEKRNQAGG